MPPENIPSPGVSVTGSSDRSAAPADEIIPVSKRRSRPRDVAQAAIDRGAKEIIPPNPVTPGVRPTQRSILEVPLNIGGGEFGVCQFTSADGETYRVRYGVAQGGRRRELRMLPKAIEKLQWCCFREIILNTPGAEVSMSVMAGMKLKLQDDDGKQLFPITIDMLRNARAGLPGVVSEIAHDDPLKDPGGDDGYGIGVEEG